MTDTIWTVWMAGFGTLTALGLTGLIALVGSYLIYPAVEYEYA